MLGGATLAPHSSMFDTYGVEFLAGDSTAAARWTIGIEDAATRTIRVFGGPRGTERLELWVNDVMVSLPWAPGMPPSRGTLTVSGVALRAGVNVIEVRQSALGLALHVDGVLIQ